jgi:adenylylsulfate kinase
VTKEKLHIIPHTHEVTDLDRSELMNHDSILVWFTGLSGSGKSTIASALEKKLHDLSIHTYILDGDNVRKGLNSDLDFTEEGRIENIRRIGEVSNLLVNAGLVVLSAFVSPFISDRSKIKELVGSNKYVEVFVDCPLEICEKRDVKGLYRKARNGEISNFTGISSPFEEPVNPDVRVESHLLSVEESVDKVYKIIKEKLELK